MKRQNQQLIKKYFYTSFNLIYVTIKDFLCIYNKENLYRKLFYPVYSSVGNEMLDYDSIRKITSGNLAIHLHVVKKLCTEEGFELLRQSVEDTILPYSGDDLSIALIEVLEGADGIPVEVVQKIKNSVSENTSYAKSRMITAILLCLNHADRMTINPKLPFFETKFMRLGCDKPFLHYPSYMTDLPNVAVETLIGREDDLDILWNKVIAKQDKILLTGVGGLGKTALTYQFLKKLAETPTAESSIEKIAWVTYDNCSICLSMKRAFHLQCDLDDVWQTVQNICDNYRERFLLVIDNIENADSDEYLRKLNLLPCRVLITSRRKSLTGFTSVMNMQPLTLKQCRELFYHHYKLPERNNEVLNDIINLTARLTIMIMFLAKVAYLEGISLRELYEKLVEYGFKLSDEDVSCEHEKLHNDETIIRQMCILFSLVNYSEKEKMILTYISLIPNLQFDLPKAKKWFKVKNNNELLKIYHIGMLEHNITERKHIYWMHSVIAAAVREQQKDKLYGLSRPFIEILTEDLEEGIREGKEYSRAYLIPFSWSVADIMENHWQEERDTVFLTNLFHVCFSCSNYKLCEKLIDLVIYIETINNLSLQGIVYAYRNKVDLMLQTDEIKIASDLLCEIEKILDEHNANEDDRDILVHQYAILYQIRGNFDESRKYHQRAIDIALNSQSSMRSRDIATGYCNMGRMLLDEGNLLEAYNYIKMSLAETAEDEDDADRIITYNSLASVCTDLVDAGFYIPYEQEARDAFNKVIKFRENRLGKYNADTAVAYHEFSHFLYICGDDMEALRYNEKAYEITEVLFAEHSISRLRTLNEKALIYAEIGKVDDALTIYEEIIVLAEEMGNDHYSDLADFVHNYANELHRLRDVEKATNMYVKCIEIWEIMSLHGNRKLSMAYQELADLLFSEGDIEEAIAHYENALRDNAEDLYMQIGILDKMSACLLLSKRTEEGIEGYKKLLDLLVENTITDEATKTQLCNNLNIILHAESEWEKDIRQLLLERIQGESKLISYVHTFDIFDIKK